MLWNVITTSDQVCIHTDMQKLLAFTQSRKGSTPEITQRIASRAEGYSESWFGMEYDRAIEMNGWPEGLEIAKRFQSMIPPMQATSIARRNVWSDVGDEFDRDRFDAGNEDCWSERKRASRRGMPILKLTCSVGAHAGHGAEDLCWMGAATFALCDAAENAGYRIELEATLCSEGTFMRRRHDLLTRITIKQADEPLNRAAAVMALSCPAFFRWHVLCGWLEAKPDWTVSNGFGRVAPQPDCLRGDLYMPHAYSAEDAGYQLRRLLAQLEQRAAA